MADTFSTALKARKIEQDAYSGSGYAEPLNSGVVDVFDAGTSGTLEIDIGSDTTYTLEPMQNGVVSETHYRRIVFIGTPASAVSIIIPASVAPFKEYVIDNQTGKLITVKYADTPGVRVPNGVAALIQADGQYVEQYEIGDAITDAEIAAPATISEYAYRPGNPFRYGADGEGGTADEDAIDAVKSVLGASTGMSQWLNLSIPGWLTTNSERSSDIVPVNFFYEPGDVRRYGVVGNGIVDDTDALNAAADAARLTTGYLIFRDDVTCKVSDTVDFTNLTVRGHGERYVHIQATAAEFDVILRNNSTKLYNLRVDGGGDGAADQLGDIISFTATAPDYPYVNQDSNCTFTNAKRDIVHIERGGYTSFWSCRALGAGRHAFYSFGTDFASNSTTTIGTGGTCQWGSCPNEAGVYIANAVNHRFNGDIIESTTGAAIKIRGDNRAHSFLGVYAENTDGKFFDWDGAAGIGIVVLGCFGGNGAIAYNSLYQSQFIPLKGNSNLSVPPAVRDELGYIELISDEITRGVADADDFTPTTASGTLPMAITLSQPGEWEVLAEMQTRESAGSPTLAAASLVLTDSATPSSVTGVQDGTNSAFLVATDFQRNVPSASCRLKAHDDYFVTTASITITVRCFLDFSGGGTSVAVKIKLVARRRIA